MKWHCVQKNIIFVLVFSLVILGFITGCKSNEQSSTPASISEQKRAEATPASSSTPATSPTPATPDTSANPGAPNTSANPGIITTSPDGTTSITFVENDAFVGYGWSVKETLPDAMEEAVGMMKKGLGEKNPDFAILFSTVGYSPEETLQDLKKRVGTGCQIYGGTSCGGVLTKDGFHTGKVGSVAVLGVSSTKIAFGVGAADMKTVSAREAGKEAIKMAIQNAKKNGQTPDFVLITAEPGKEEDVILGIEDVTGNQIPIIGGSSGDNDISGKWKQFANDRVYDKGVVVTAIYSDYEIHWAYEMGYLKSEKGGTITKAEGRTIYEIDHRPASEIYNEWADGALGEKLQKGGTVLGETTMFPLAKVLRGKEGQIHYLSIHPLAINLPERSLSVFANVKEGDELLFLNGNRELLLTWCQSTPKKAITGVPKEMGLFGIFTYCAGTMLAIPEAERSKMPGLVNEGLGGVPFIGICTFGEQGFLPGVGNRHGNLINSMVVFTRIKKAK